MYFVKVIHSTFKFYALCIMLQISSVTFAHIPEVPLVLQGVPRQWQGRLRHVQGLSHCGNLFTGFRNILKGIKG